MVPDERKDRWAPRLNKQWLKVTIRFLKTENYFNDIWRYLISEVYIFPGLKQLRKANTELIINYSLY